MASLGADGGSGVGRSSGRRIRRHQVALTHGHPPFWCRSIIRPANSPAPAGRPLPTTGRSVGRSSGRRIRRHLGPAAQSRLAEVSVDHQAGEFAGVGQHERRAHHCRVSVDHQAGEFAGISRSCYRAHYGGVGRSSGRRIRRRHADLGTPKAVVSVGRSSGRRIRRRAHRSSPSRAAEVSVDHQAGEFAGWSMA